MNHETTVTIVILMTFSGCTAFSNRSTQPVATVSSEAVRQAIQDGEYYRARQMTQTLLNQEPQNLAYQTTMAEILDKEISEQKEAFESKVPEEWNSEDKKTQAKTWLERSQELLRRAEYEQAYDAAEQVFTYDPQNLEASELMDKIRKQAEQEGKSQKIFVKEMYQSEAKTRIEEYKEQARILIEEGQWGKARLTAEKIMLLDPKDRDAAKLLEQISQHSEARVS